MLGHPPFPNTPAWAALLLLLLLLSAVVACDLSTEPVDEDPPGPLGLRNDPVPELESIDVSLLGGDRIAFHRAYKDDAAVGIYVVNGATGAVRGHLGGSLLSHPAVSPDGQMVAFKTLSPFVSGQDVTFWDIYASGLGGEGLVQVAAFPGNVEGPPAWTPDGRLLFSIRSQNLVGTTLYEQSPVEGPGDRRQVHRFTSSGEYVWDLRDHVPARANDGTIAVLGSGLANRGIHVRSPLTGQLTRVYHGVEAPHARALAFSPDGGSLAFLAWDDDRTYVSVLDLAADAIHELGSVEGSLDITLSPGNDWSICWTTSGERIVFTAPTLGTMSAHVHVVRADGSEPPARLTTAPEVVDRSVSCLA